VRSGLKPVTARLALARCLKRSRKMLIEMMVGLPPGASATHLSRSFNRLNMQQQNALAVWLIITAIFVMLLIAVHAAALPIKELGVWPAAALALAIVS
jgi:hypothetical protein